MSAIDFDFSAWDYRITGEAFSWTITWDLPLGLTMTAYVTFDEVQYLGPEVERGEAWGAPYRHIRDAEAHAHGGKVVRIVVGGHEVDNDILWAEVVKAKVVPVVAKYAEEMKLDEMGQS